MFDFVGLSLLHVALSSHYMLPLFAGQNREKLQVLYDLIAPFRSVDTIINFASNDQNKSHHDPGLGPPLLLDLLLDIIMVNHDRFFFVYSFVYQIDECLVEHDLVSHAQLASTGMFGIPLE